MAKDRKRYRFRPREEEGAPRIQIPPELAESIAAKAREGYQYEGRGVVVVSIGENVPVHWRTSLNISGSYIPMTRIRQVRAAIPSLSDDEYEEIVGLVNAYNPLIHFVVLLSLGNNVICYRGEHPVQFVQTA